MKTYEFESVDGVMYKFKGEKIRNYSDFTIVATAYRTVGGNDVLVSYTPYRSEPQVIHGDELVQLRMKNHRIDNMFNVNKIVEID